MREKQRQRRRDRDESQRESSDGKACSCPYHTNWLYLRSDSFQQTPVLGQANSNWISVMCTPEIPMRPNPLSLNIYGASTRYNTV